MWPFSVAVGYVRFARKNKLEFTAAIFYLQWIWHETRLQLFYQAKIYTRIKYKCVYFKLFLFTQAVLRHKEKLKVHYLLKFAFIVAGEVSYLREFVLSQSIKIYSQSKGSVPQ